MSRRSEELMKQHEQKVSQTVSKIYLSSIVDVLSDIELVDGEKLSKDEINYILCQLTDKVVDLTKGYIDLETYIQCVEEKTGINLS